MSERCSTSITSALQATQTDMIGNAPLSSPDKWPQTLTCLVLSLDKLLCGKMDLYAQQRYVTGYMDTTLFTVTVLFSCGNVHRCTFNEQIILFQTHILNYLLSMCLYRGSETPTTWPSQRAGRQAGSSSVLQPQLWPGLWQALQWLSGGY